MPNPPRLIEVDLPIKAISAHARREKSIRHGHISTLHIWWARRPLAACRAVLCAALWPDPADDACSQAFRDVAALVLAHFAEQVRTDRALAELCAAHWSRWNRTNEASLRPADPACWPDLRYALLDFIADFANWDASTQPAFLEAARLLTRAAHLGDSGFSIADFGLPEYGPRTVLPLPEQIQSLRSKIANLPRPLVADPFAGGAAIPLEALRVGADAFASDLNPVAVLLNKVVLEYIPKYGKAADADRGPETGDRGAGLSSSVGGQPSLAEAVRSYGAKIKAQAEAELAEFYPADEDGATPIAYLWARTVTCEGPGCGAELPLMRSLWLAKKRGGGRALRWVKDKAGRVQTEMATVTYANGETREVRRPLLGIFAPKSAKEVDDAGTVARGAATCPCCGYTTPVESVRRQLKARRGGADDARLFCVVTTHPGEQGRFYRLPTARDLEAVEKAKAELERRKGAHTGPLSLVPDEELDVRGIRHTWSMIYGFERWEYIFTSRQALVLTTLIRLLGETDLSPEKTSLLALVIDRQADKLSSLARWDTSRENAQGTFGRQALPMVWDYCEANPFSGFGGDWENALEWVVRVIENNAENRSEGGSGQVQCASATAHPLPDGSVNAFITDPPYYDAVPYAYLSDFFYVWLKRSLGAAHPELFGGAAVPKDEEIVVDRPHELSNSTHDIAFYERELTKAFAEGRRILQPDGIGVIVFASKTTASWEAILQAVIDAGWVITGSWPIDTEMEARVAAQGQARLGSSIHLVVRPRAASAVSPQPSAFSIGDWRDVLHALPERIHAWMPRLAEAGIVGADAIFACLGPALELFSRYDRVEKASGEQITLGMYLEHVWASVSREALSMIFAGADATGFEEDARLTAMWLWTLSTDDAALHGQGAVSLSPDDDDGDDAATPAPVSASGYTLEYDAARKIAQGLGAHLELLTHLVEIKGSAARLLPVAARSKHLFGEDVRAPAARRKAAAPQQLGFGDMAGVEGEVGAADWTALQSRLESEGIALGETVLDRLHQSMLLFAAGRSDALKRLLVDEGVGQDGRFWRLAQALSALYPLGSEEKRWVDGVMARKKGLGF